MGTCYQQMNQIDDALHEFKIAINLNPTNGAFYLNRALVLGKLEKYDVIICYILYNILIFSKQYKIFLNLYHYLKNKKILKVMFLR